MSRHMPTDFVRENILTYKVKPCQTVVFYLNFDWNMRADWMIYQNFGLPVNAFVDTYSLGTGSYRTSYAVEVPCTNAVW